MGSFGWRASLPLLAFIFGFGIYGMQSCIEKHFVHISGFGFGFVLGV
jgi:hypothetical protein